MSGYLVMPGRLASGGAVNGQIKPRVFAFSILFNDIKHPVTGYQINQLREDLVKLIDMYAR